MNHKENINFIFQMDNKNRSGNFFAFYISGGILLSAGAVVCVAFKRYDLLIAVSVLSIAYIILLNCIKPSFFELLVTNQRLQVNYYSVASTFRTYQSIEMELFQLKGFTIERKMAGLKMNLIISVASKFGIADYPPVSLALLSKAEIARVVHVLNEIMNSNRSA